MASRQWLAVVLAALIGGGASALVASCGEDRGDVQIEGGTTGAVTTGAGTVTVDTNATTEEGPPRP
jgi:hypothetical protein